MSCCPPNAEKYLAPDYSAIGSILTLDSGYEAYQTGDVTATKKAVILIPDIYGWNGGRTRNIADYLVGYGYYVVVPKLLTPPIDGGTDGDGFKSFEGIEHLLAGLKDFMYADTLHPKVAAFTAYLKSHGIEKIGVLGFCWGGWVGAHMASNAELLPSLNALLVGHPSIQLEGAWGGNPQTLHDTVQLPTLFLPARGDSEDYHEGGKWFDSIKSRFPTSKSIVFPDVEHGFIPRADLSNPVNKEAVDRSLDLIVEFLQAHV